MKLFKYTCPSCGLIFWTQELINPTRCPQVLCTSWKVQKAIVEFHTTGETPIAKTI